MHVFWARDEATIADVRDAMASHGLDRAYTTIATLVRILNKKGFLDPIEDRRPARYRTARSFEVVSPRLLGDVLERVFKGSSEQLLVRLVEQRRLTAEERAKLRKILGEDQT
jgi:BlaI family transcriptional regulator, penicillinase repressor